MNFTNSSLDNHNSINNNNNNRENKQLAIAAFFYNNPDRNSNSDVQPLFEEFILTNKFSRFSVSLKQKRNYLIYLTLFQVVASIVGMFYMVIRRSYVYLVINLLTLFLAFCGAYGSIRLHDIALVVHCIFTTSITGGFFFYQFIDFFLSTQNSDMEKKRASESVVLFIFSMPYVFDLICGIFCYYFLKQKATENTLIKGEHEKLKEEIDEINSKVSHDKFQDHFRNINQETCVICMSNRRNTAFNPCGHYLCCDECASELFGKYTFAKPKCPICRKECQSFVKIIVS